MDFLLKIVEGPMKGAEVALVAGTRVKVGASDACDIVLADAVLADEAFELDVGDDSVMLILPDGSQQTLNPFEIHDFGTSAFAIGPSDAPWEELRRPSAEEAAAPSAADTEEPAESTPEASAEKGEEDAPAAEPAPAEAAAEEERKADASEKTSEKKESKGFWAFVFAFSRWILIGVALLLLLLLALLLWWYWPRGDKPSPSATDETVQEQTAATLEAIARQYALELSKDGGVPLLKGNLQRRTERLAIRALALAADRNCRFDLTDDESLRLSADELLFASTDGALKADAASNRVVTLSGYAPNAQALERALRALNADVPQIAKLVTAGIRVGGPRPPSKGVPPSAHSESAEPVEAAFAPPVEPRPAPTALRGGKAPAKPAYPIAGILTRPYPCVVMRNGDRVMEGAQIGAATLVRIEAEKLVLKEGERTFELVP